jgi:hypothetical protein
MSLCHRTDRSAFPASSYKLNIIIIILVDYYEARAEIVDRWRAKDFASFGRMSELRVRIVA